MDRDDADSDVFGIMVIIMIMIILCAIFFLSISYFLTTFLGPDTLAPPLIKIMSVSHVTQQGVMKLASRVVIQNTDKMEYRNRDLKAMFYRNNEQLYAIINTLHGEEFIPTQHFGVSTMGGSGCSGEYFSPGEMILIDLKNGYYAPGDRVELRIYQRSSDSSSYSSPITGFLTDKWYMKEWLDENVYSSRSGYHILSQHRFIA